MPGEHIEWLTSKIANTLARRTAAEFPDLQILAWRGGVHSSVCLSEGDRWCAIFASPLKYRIPRKFGVGLPRASYEVYLHVGNLPIADGRIEDVDAFTSVYLNQRRSRVADGRTEDLEEVLSCVTAWVGERLPLPALYRRVGFIDRNRRALKKLARHLDRAQREAGSDILTVMKQKPGNDMAAELYFDGGQRSCFLKLAEGARIRCSFMDARTLLAEAELPGPHAAARGINLWLDQGVTLDRLSGEIGNLALTDFGDAFERGDVTRWKWLTLIASARGWCYEASHVPILERFMETPEINRFVAHTSMDRIRFLKCPYAASSLGGMPVVTPTPSGYIATCDDHQEMEGDVDDIVAFVAKCLERIPDPPCVGCSRDVFLEPINACLAERGSALRVVQTEGWNHCNVSVRRGNRTCGFATTDRPGVPYRVNFYDQVERNACGFFKTIPDVATAVEMWLGEGCEFKDVAAVAHRIFVVF